MKKIILISVLIFFTCPHLVFADDTYIFPNNYVPTKYVTGGWTEETHISKNTDSTGTTFLMEAAYPFQPPHMLGGAWSNPNGQLIYKVEFNYETNFDPSGVIAGMDYPNMGLFWRSNMLGGGQSASINLPGVQWFSLGLYISKPITPPSSSWHLKVWNVKIYLTPPIDSGILRVSPLQGGAINYFEVNGVNFIDNNDCGRLVQVDFGDGSDITSTCPGFGTTKWNPTQACDSNACGPHYTGSSQVIYNGIDLTSSYQNSMQINGFNTTVISNQILDWLGNGTRSPYTLKQTTKQTQFPNIFSVDYELTNLGASPPRSQYISFELPALFIPSSLTDRFIAYVGQSPWQNQPLAEWINGTSSQYNPANQAYADQYGMVKNATERWLGIVNTNHDGIVVYYPSQSIPSPGILGLGADSFPQGATTNHANVHYIFADVPNNTTFKFRVYLAAGHLETIRPLLQNLPATSSFTPTPTPTPLPGDLNHDYKVNISDYNILLQNFGNTTCGNVADIDGNCKVDIFDYNTLIQNFGSPR